MRLLFSSHSPKSQTNLPQSCVPSSTSSCCCCLYYCVTEHCNYTFNLFLLPDQITIETFLEATDPSIPGRVFITLDRLTDEKWQNLGMKLGVDRGDLKAITTSCANQHQNPAGEVIEVICTRHPTMTIGQFKKKLINIKRTDVRNKLDHLHGECSYSY